MSLILQRHEELSCLLQGYIFGGVIAGPLGWRAAFWIEAAAMLPFVLFCALAPPIDLKGMHTGVALIPKQAFTGVVQRSITAEPGHSQGKVTLYGHQYASKLSVSARKRCLQPGTGRSYSGEMSCSEGAAALTHF